MGKYDIDDVVKMLETMDVRQQRIENEMELIHKLLEEQKILIRGIIENNML